MNGTEYGQLLIFQTIAREGSISACARALGISVPAVSKALQQLEKRLGVPLFQRSTRKIQLTETGIQLLAQTSEAVEILTAAFEKAKIPAQIPTGTVRITVSQVAFSLIIQPIYAEFRRHYPHILLDISINNAAVNLIEERFDLGIRFGNSLEDGMVAHKLTGEIREGLFISPKYAQQYGTPKTVAELAQHQLIGYRLITANRLHPLTLMVNEQPQLIEMPMSLIINDSEMMIDAICQGFGVGRIFEPQYERIESKIDLLPILKPHWQTFQPLYLYYPPKSQNAKRVQVLIKFLQERAKP
ncbi:LysR family transcriptional regulator [Muribacter muris]|uniref:LysR family transcriptional regulator n=1 Tax=Muribacter muris TaxID=67855 RepID=A0A4Y9K4J3_9PAST|nr:LysR family transcriptional regulator [Muribacter muris]MBF0784243.1 LysR family transcriptional regulator [Muribacter muris]MBF0827019.1 LysR family transcriptional regulator [Muribacter muris]TFV12984.1 LysR family transcriptional regulator [Muribacter muris]